MAVRFIKKKIYPRPHDLVNRFCLSADATDAKSATIFPIIRYDEGLGDPA